MRLQGVPVVPGLVYAPAVVAPDAGAVLASDAGTAVGPAVVRTESQAAAAPAAVGGHAAGAGSGTETGSATETGSGVETGSATETGSGVETGWATETGSGVETGWATETGSGNGTRPGGGWDPDSVGAYDQAVARVAARLESEAGRRSGAVAEVLGATAALALDPALRDAVVARLEAGHPPAASVRAAVEEFAVALEAAGGRTAERAVDLRDLGRRVAAAMSGDAEPRLLLPRTPCVLVAADLAPVEVARLDRTRVLALVLERGGPTGHTAVIARELGIPCVVAVPDVAAMVRPGVAVLVDGGTGEVEIAPEDRSARERVARDTDARARVAAWRGPGRTGDGTRVRLLANVADGPSARAAAGAPVEGVGLFRTELCFLDREEEPSVVEQAEAYAEVLGAFGSDRTVVVRTLDAGSDKPVAFATPGREENPALGVRGLRLSIRHPGLLERQLRAIEIAARRTATEPWVMAPMVATVAEAADFAAQVRGYGLRAGAMVEVPAAALQARRLLDHLDFLSVGTNDLTQYTMAADRTAGALAHLADPWQPAVLSLVAMSAEAGRHADKPVGVCGEAAADPMLAAVLVGLGVTSLSMAPAAVRAVGARIGSVSMATCEHAAELALAADDAMAARQVVRRVLARART